MNRCSSAPTALCAALLGALVLAPARTSALARPAPSAMPLPLHVSGTQLLNSREQPVLLRGVNTASMEWSSDGEGHILQTVETAIRDWHVNHIRLPLAQDRWFGKAPEQTDDGKAYRALVKQVVDACAGHGCYIFLDLHWNDAGEWGKQIGQHVMPDENSIAFWKEVAAAYKDHPAVLFDLYNEPHDVTWDIWHDGGMVTEKNRRAGTEKTYQAVGMQALLDTVRAAGAKNVAIAGGLDWSYRFPGFPEGKPLADPKGNGVIYANHAYPMKREPIDRWTERMEAAAKQLPVIVSEFGSDGRRFGAPPDQPPQGPDPWVVQVLKVLHDHNWSWTAWDLHPRAGPRLISDWSYTPTPAFGALVKEALGGVTSNR